MRHAKSHFSFVMISLRSAALTDSVNHIDELKILYSVSW